MELLSARIEKPEAINFILGQTHFIKTVEDLHEALVGAVPGIRFAWRSARRLESAWCAGAAPIPR